MRRIGAILALLVAAVLALSAGAGADDTRSYRIEMHNAFEVLEGSEVRIAGVRSGEVTAIDVNAAKRAVASVEISGPLATLGERTRCSTEPQSLIAEYFIDCRPAGPPLAEGATIPASQVTQTVQTDLLFNSLRLPYRERLRLIVNEFGTALAGNAENLSEAIRLSVPALTDLRRVSGILSRQRGRLAQLNDDAERVLARLAGRRGDAASAISEARDVASLAAGRRTELARDADLLDDLLAELRPTLAELGEAARAGTPVLASLRASAPGLDTLGARLPRFGRSAGRALAALGNASGPGRVALARGREELRALAAAGRKAPVTGEILADLLRDLADPGRSVETDARAARSCENRTRPCWATGRDAPTGFTGLESILNYTRYQAGALNQFDELGHILQFNVFSGGSGPCDDFNARPNVPARGGGRTKEILEADPCVGWLGPNQPDVTFDLGLPRYDDSVCPHGSTHPEICDPEISTAASSGATGEGGSLRVDRAPGGARAPGESDDGPLPEAPRGGASAGTGAPGSLEDVLELPEPDASGGNGTGAAGDLLDFLFDG